MASPIEYLEHGERCHYIPCPDKDVEKDGVQEHHLNPKTISSIQACRTRVVLTEAQVIRIFQVRIANESASSNAGKKVRAFSLAMQYGVNEKTIRDVWSGRTWCRETLPFDPTRKNAGPMKVPGRPKGSVGSSHQHNQDPFLTCQYVLIQNRHTISDSNRPNLKSAAYLLSNTKILVASE
jgi:hypothetical protein